MLVFLNKLLFREALWKKGCTGLFDDSSAQKLLSMSDCLRYKSDLYSVLRTHGTMIIIPLEFLRVLCNVAVMHTFNLIAIEHFEIINPYCEKYAV